MLEKKFVATYFYMSLESKKGVTFTIKATTNNRDKLMKSIKSILFKKVILPKCDAIGKCIIERNTRQQIHHKEIRNYYLNNLADRTEKKEANAKEKRVVLEEGTRKGRIAALKKWDEFKIRKEAVIAAYLDVLIPIKFKVRIREWYKVIKTHWWIGIYMENMQRLIIQEKMYRFIKILMFTTHILRHQTFHTKNMRIKRTHSEISSTKNI